MLLLCGAVSVGALILNAQKKCMAYIISGRLTPITKVTKRWAASSEKKNVRMCIPRIEYARPGYHSQ